MKDEEYLFHQDVREKKITGYSARKQRSHCGKRGRVKFPSDYLSKKELKKMSGEVKSYRLNEPMKWHEFKDMPEDIQIAYIKLIRDKWNPPVVVMAEMLGCDRANFSRHLLHLGFGKQPRGKRVWDKTGFAEWAYGLPKTEETQPEEVKEECPVQYTHYDPVAEEFEKTVEEDIAVSTEETTVCEADDFRTLCEAVADDTQKVCAIPDTGSLTFTGNAVTILNTLGNLLGYSKVLLSVKWDVVE